MQTVFKSWLENNGSNERLNKIIEKYGHVLATGHQNGYTLRIHDLKPHINRPFKVTDKNRDFDVKGIMSIESPSGDLVIGGKWMDWNERHYPANYAKLSKAERASLEVEEQKKYGYKKNFEFHKSHSEKNAK